MTKHFIVAGHRFAFTMDDGKELWQRLTNYAPFETEVSDAETVFSLEFVDSMERMNKVPVYVEKAEEEDQPRIEIYRRADEDGKACEEVQWIIEMAPVQKMPICARLLASEDFSCGKLAVASDRIADFAVNNAMMILYAFTTATRGTLEMHSSVIKNGGKGYMFLGKSGTGKSTHSSLWLKHIPGSELMNDDNPVVVATDEGAIIYGSPWSGKTPCYRNVSAPIGAFVRIKQEKENHIERDNTLQAFASLLPSVSSMKWDDRVFNGICDSLSLLVEHVPCYTLGCRPDKEAADICAATVKVN